MGGVGSFAGGIIWVLFVVVAIVSLVRKKKLRGRIGPGASGTVYELLNEDKRNAIEIIVEERAGARDPEDRDGNLPDLANPRRS